MSLQPIFWLSVFDRLPKQLDADVIARGFRGVFFRIMRPLELTLAALVIWILLFIALSELIYGSAKILTVILGGLIVILVLLQLAGRVADHIWPMQLERVAAASEN